MSSPSDDALIERYLSGNAAAFDTLFDRYASRLIGFLISVGAPYDDADDLAQRTWMKALDAMDRYDRRGRFRSWLFTLAYRLWMSEARSPARRRRAPMVDEALAQTPAPDADPRTAASKREERDRLLQAIAELPNAMRETLLLRIDGDLTFREIAETMGCAEGTIHWRMQEAKRRLRERLAPEPAMPLRGELHEGRA